MPRRSPPSTRRRPRKNGRTSPRGPNRTGRNGRLFRKPQDRPPKRRVRCRARYRSGLRWRAGRSTRLSRDTTPRRPKRHRRHPPRPHPFPPLKPRLHRPARRPWQSSHRDALLFPRSSRCLRRRARDQNLDKYFPDRARPSPQPRWKARGPRRAARYPGLPGLRRRRARPAPKWRARPALRRLRRRLKPAHSPVSRRRVR